MKLRVLRIAAVTAFSAVLGTLLLPAAFAQDNSRDDRPLFQGGRMHGPDMGPQRRGAPRQRDAATMIARLDSNDDDKVSEEEFLTQSLSRLDDMFERRDSNNDGLITEGEGRRDDRGAGKRGPGPEQRGVTREEIAECVRDTIPDFDPVEPPTPDDIAERFDEVDTNDDGGLSLAEVSAAAETRAKARFARLDANADSFITAEEIETQQAQQRELRKTMRSCARELAND